MFLTQINSSLVDSNMLVRCIVLSLDRFESQTEDVKGKWKFDGCKLVLEYLRQNLLWAFSFISFFFLFCLDIWDFNVLKEYIKLMCCQMIVDKI